MNRLSFSAFFFASLILLGSSSGSFSWLTNSITEFRFGLVTRAPTDRVAVVEIDAQSLDAIGVWPWPRSIHARIIDELTLLGASEIAFDIDFSARSTPEDDQALETALERAGGGVILAIFDQSLSSASGAGDIYTNRPLERFARNAWAASVNVFADADGRVRAFPLGQTANGESVPSIPALLGGYFGEMNGQFAIDFGIRAADIDRISAIDILEGRTPRSRIEGRKLIVGAGAAELRDTFSVPAYGIMSGPLLQALGTDTILQNRMLSSTGTLVDGAGLLLLLAILLFAHKRRGWLTALLALAVSSVLFEASGILLQTMAPIVLDTAAWHVGTLIFALLVLVREIDVRQILLFISRRETRNTRTVLDQVVADNFDGVVVVGEDGCIRAASRVAAEILGSVDYTAIEGASFADVLPAEMSSAVKTALECARTGTLEDVTSRETQFSPADGSADKIVEFVATPSSLEGGVDSNGKVLANRAVACLTFRDVTQKRHAEDRLNYLARNDTLTGLANRNAFCDRLDTAIADRGAGRMSGAVLCFDLDRFRNVNDTLGHAIGDLVLCEVVARVAPIVADCAVFARFGADEFAILCTKSTKRTDTAKLARAIVEAVSEPMVLEGYRVIIGTSVGICELGAEQTDSEQMIRNADTALYRAKRDGGAGHQFFDPEMDDAILERRRLEMELWTAYERNEFEVVYQPQFSLNTREINGVEALVRWRHPEKGYISPVVFIPVAEDIGLIEQIGEFVLRTACHEVASWPVPLKVAVNLSSVQFQRGDLVSTVASALADSGLPCDQFELEITESLLMHDGARAEGILAELRAMGIRFALDDFGTGYSSLSYIRRFPIHKIKIDRAFVIDLPADQESLAIIRAITTLADNLGLTTTVEGIETEDQAKLLFLAGCDQGQGYLFSKPKSGEQIVEMLNSSVPEHALPASSAA